jgi:hypothetical protein
LKLDHQLNQLVLAQALQISAIHAHMDSEIALPGKGVGKYSRIAVKQHLRSIVLTGASFALCFLEETAQIMIR